MLTRPIQLLAALIVIPATFGFGGWAVVTVDEMPEYAVAGRPLELTYTVRQHGQTPRGDLASTVDIRSGGRRLTVPAQSMGEGVYRARLDFPQAGTWDIRVNSGWGAVGGELLPLRVIAANAPAPARMSASERGHQLYLAKGCATCHTHQLTKDVSSVKQGPDLTEPKFSVSYLSRYLANPAIKTEWKSAARMPNLGLKPDEITALVSFLNRN